MTLTPEDVRRVAAVLSQAVLDAGALERLTVPAAARLDPAVPPANVVPFSPRDVAVPVRTLPSHPEPAA